MGFYLMVEVNGGKLMVGRLVVVVGGPLGIVTGNYGNV